MAAQSNGKIINYSNIARNVGVEDKTVKNYFSLLEDTLISDCEAVCFSNEPRQKKMGNITVYPWNEGIKHYFYKEESWQMTNKINSKKMPHSYYLKNF